MVTAERARNEGRKRDVKRRRIVLKVGEMEWHLTRDEARKLRDKLDTLLRSTDEYTTKMKAVEAYCRTLVVRCSGCGKWSPYPTKSLREGVAGHRCPNCHRQYGVLSEIASKR